MRGRKVTSLGVMIRELIHTGMKDDEIADWLMASVRGIGTNRARLAQSVAFIRCREKQKARRNQGVMDG